MQSLIITHNVNSNLSLYTHSFTVAILCLLIVLQRCQHQLFVTNRLPTLRITLHTTTTRIPRQRIAALPATAFAQLGNLFMQQLVVLPDEADQVFRHLVRFSRDPALLAAFQNHRHFLAVYAQGDRGDAVRLVTLSLGAFTFCRCGHVIPPIAALWLLFSGGRQ